MSITDQIILGPRLKVKRAHRHIDELVRRTSPLDRDLYEITVEKVRRVAIERKPSVTNLTYRPKQPVPETFAVIIGDVVHNLRAALDHLATGIVRLLPSGEPNAQIHFPMRKHRKDLITGKTDLPTIEKALPGATKLLLDEIRPHGGPNESLWSFHSLNNDDKHNLVLPTITIASVNNLNARSRLGTYVNCSVGGNAAHPKIFLTSDVPITIDKDFNTSVEIEFGKGTPFENDSVIPTLLQIAQLVADTIDIFERHLRKAGF